MNSLNGKTTETRGYAPVNGLKMYYQIEGAGETLVYNPPVLGQPGVKPFPTLVSSHRGLNVDLPGDGRPAEIPGRPITLGQNAKGRGGPPQNLGNPTAGFFVGS